MPRPRKKNPSRHTTIGELIQYLMLGSGHELDRKKSFAKWWHGICAWPPNLFALTASILHESGVYRIEHTEYEASSVVHDWMQAVRPNLELTDDCCRHEYKMPAKLAELGRHLESALDQPFIADDDNPNDKARRALIALHCLADEACMHASTPTPIVQRSVRFKEAWSATHRAAALRRLHARGTLACLDTSKIRILPKKHTPQVGVTLRSHSLYAAAVRGEVDVRWATAVDKEPASEHERRVNLLLVPWPLHLDASSFKAIRTTDDYSQFDYDPKGNNTDVVQCFRKIAKALERQSATVDGVVFPELALSSDDFARVRAVMSRSRSLRNAFLMSGVRVLEKRDRPAANEAWLAIGAKRIRQEKHHKWCIDDTQIRQYHLGSSLPPYKGVRYWERMAIGQRRINFVHWRTGLTLCPLICEDLARVEPVAEVIRAVGPNLLVALLLDGPQLEKRWSGRYASVFADDPGSSVLTLTALGFVKRSIGRGESRMSTVALWKDQLTGTRELPMAEGSVALLLSLCTNHVTEHTYDGRHDGQTGVLTFGGVEDVFLS